MKLNIKDQMNKAGITRYELAQRINVTYPTIDKIYKGESTSIKLEILEAICKELNCSPSEIFDSDDPQMKRLLVCVDKVNYPSAKANGISDVYILNKLQDDGK